MAHLRNLKLTIFISMLLVCFTACNNKKTGSRDIQLLSDSSAYNNNTLSDSAKMNEKLEASKTGTVHHENSGSHASQSGSGGSNGTNGTASTDNSNGTSSSSSSTTQGTQKKGWSKAAQGAVIGGAVGAVGGAIVSKKKGTGAAVGAAVGAAGGYIIGREKDKKDGRVKK